MILRRCIRTNKWHAVSVSVTRNNLGTGFGYEYDIRINSDPGVRSASSYLTPDKARELAALLLKAADVVDAKTMRAQLGGKR